MVFALERIGWKTKRYIFMIATLFSSLYLFEPSNPIVKSIVEYQLETVPFINVKNILGIALFVLFIALKYLQVM